MSRQGGLRIERMCQLAQVSRAGFYRSLQDAQPVEEEMLVEAYLAVVARHPSAQLLLAPRHIERADAVEAMVRDRGLTVRRRTATHAIDALRPHVVILDSRGELAAVYEQATVAFVGGTLVPIGGHNLLEPAFWAKPVLFGPYTDHCVEIANLLVQAGGGCRVTTAEGLAAALARLFDQHDERVVGRAPAVRRACSESNSQQRDSVYAW